MLQLIAAIPLIFEAMSKVSKLFSAGKEAAKSITGSPSVASTPEELQTEILNLNENQQNLWAEVMSKQVDMYAAQNERLAIELGLIDRNITGKLDVESASEVALLRMTTRPWAVRWMVRYILFPFALVVVDVIQQLTVTWLPFLKQWINPFSTFEYVFGVLKWPSNIDASILEKMAGFVSGEKGPTTFAGELYIQSLPWVVGVVISYMGLREYGKRRGISDTIDTNKLVKNSPISIVSKTLNDGVGLVSKIRKWFN